MKSKYKVLLILLLILFLIFLFMLLFYKKNKVNELDVLFLLNGALTQEVLVGEEYQELGASLLINDEDNSKLLKIDSSMLDINKVGEYEVKYYTIINGYEYSKSRKIMVVDKNAPEILLVGGDITILLDENFQDPGYDVSDNYDENLFDNVIIQNNIDNKKEGIYDVIYSVSDSSGNKCEVKRKVTVKKPNEVVKVIQEVKVESPKIDVMTYDNTITKNKFSDMNIYLEGYVKNDNESVLKFVGNNEYKYDLEINNHKYNIIINISDFDDGDYKLYINDELLLNKMTYIERINRGKVGDKLVTFNYNDDGEVSVNIQNHSYLYDILIDPGHGGYDTGAVNQYISEKEMNLIVSNYEKCRYEAHGLKVYMTRDDDNYGNGMGLSSLPALHRRAYEMAYYGAVSKIVYSNHHNSIGNDYYGGYEIILPATLSSSMITNEYNIMNKFNQIYPNFYGNDGHKRFYARDYDTEILYSKINGEVFNFKDNYAVNRIPYQISNVKSVIFEASYISNMEDFNWYWQNKNWYKVSEAKIETYVNSLGVTYNSDNSGCL